MSINEIPGLDFTSIEYSLSTSSPIHNVYGHFTFREWEWDSCEEDDDDDSLDEEDEDDSDDDELDDELDASENLDNEQMSANENKIIKNFISLFFDYKTHGTRSCNYIDCTLALISFLNLFVNLPVLLIKFYSPESLRTLSCDILRQ